MSWLASAIGGGTGLVGDIYSTYTQKQIANSNLGLQRENFEYQKWLNSEQWNRDDTAVQRRVADLKEAGLSPVLAAGSAASTSSPIKTEAPQKDASYASGYSKVTDSINAAMGLATSMATIEKQMADISKTRAEEDYIHLQNRRGQLALNLDTQLLPHQVQKLLLENAYKNGQIDMNTLNKDIAKYNLDISRHYNIRTTDTTNPFNYFLGGTKTLGENLNENIGPLMQLGGQKMQEIVDGVTHTPKKATGRATGGGGGRAW